MRTVLLCILLLSPGSATAQDKITSSVFSNGCRLTVIS